MEAVLAHNRAMAERKELARKQKERALAQMQNMQRRFLERNRQQMLDLDTSVEEVYALSTTSLSLLAVYTHTHTLSFTLPLYFDAICSISSFIHTYAHTFSFTRSMQKKLR